MCTVRLALLFLILTFLVGGSSQVDALVLCATKKGARVVMARETCGASETQLNPVMLGLQGGKGDRGGTGLPGPQGLKGEKGDAGSQGAFASDIPAWVQAGILLLTGGIVLCYTVETKRLREAAQKQVEESQKQVRESQRQIELQLRPYVILEAIREGPTRGFQLRNVGNGTAIDVKVRDVQVKFPDITGTISFRDPILILSRGDKIKVGSYTVYDGKEEREDMSNNPNEFTQALLPHVNRLVQEEAAHPLPDPPEIILEFKNIERQPYFVKERLEYGRLTILDSGKL